MAVGGGSGGLLGTDLSKALDGLVSSGGPGSDIVSFGDLDQKPRVLHQPAPRLTPAMRKRTPGRVRIAFIVNPRGRVERPRIVDSTDSVFDGPALAAVRKWRFEPAKSGGKVVSFRYRVPITFPRM